MKADRSDALIYTMIALWVIVMLGLMIYTVRDL